MPQSFLPYQNASLGVSPESLNQFWEQFQFNSLPNGAANMGVASDCAVIYQLTSAQLLALNTTAVQLVAPPITTGLGNLVPPGGYLYVPTTLTLQYKYGGTAYTIAGTTPVIQIEYTGQAVSLISLTPTGLVDQVAGRFATSVAPTNANQVTTAGANLGLEVKLGGTTPSLTLGNGTVNLYMLYNVIALY